MRTYSASSESDIASSFEALSISSSNVVAPKVLSASWKKTPKRGAGAKKYSDLPSKQVELRLHAVLVSRQLHIFVNVR